MYTYLVGYDIACNSSRVRFAEALLDLGGLRLQRSVFAVALDGAGVVALRESALGQIDAQTDRVHWYRTCGNCPGVVAAVPPLSLAGPWEGSAWIV